MNSPESVPFPQRVFILFWSHSYQKEHFANHLGHELHAHADAWQLEFVERGNIRFRTGNDVCDVLPGEVVIIPPGVRHLFIYGKGRKDTWSVKFGVRGAPTLKKAMTVNAAPPVSLLIRFILSLMPDATNKSHAVLLEYLIADLLDILCQKGVPETPILSMINNVMYGGIKEGLSVGEIAAKLGYSKDHLSKIVKKHYGVPIKKRIDHERYSLAKKLLMYSDDNITEISERLGYPDVFSFSRFFKKMNGGDGPLKYRRFARVTGNPRDKAQPGS